MGGQAINFADIPAELLGNVQVYKNTTADMIEGGLAGTVNLNTRLPFDKKGLNVAFDAEGNYGDFRKKWTPTVSGLISDTFDTELGRFGLLASGSFSQIRSRADGIQVTNFQTRDNALVPLANTNDVIVCRNPLPGNTDTMTLPPANASCGTGQTAGADGFADTVNNLYAPVGGQFRTQEYNRKRDGIALAGQFESIDQRTLFTAQFLRSHTTNSWGERTFETAPDNSEYNTYPKGCLQNANGPALNETDFSARAECPVGQFTNYQYDDNGLFQSGYITSPNDGWRGAGPGSQVGPAGDQFGFIPAGGMQQSLSRRQVFEETTNTDYGMHLRHDFTDRLTIDVDADYTRSRHRVQDFSVFGSTFADEELDITGNLPVVTPHKPLYLTYSWAGQNPNLAGLSDQQYFSNPNVQFWRAAMDHFEDSKGDEFAYKADATYKFDDDSVLREAKFGARYAARDQTIRYTTYNWGVLSEIWAGSTPVGFASTNSANYSFYDFPNFFKGDTPGPVGGFYYNGDLLKDYDQSASFFKSINQQWVANLGQAGWTPRRAARRCGWRIAVPSRRDQPDQAGRCRSLWHGALRHECAR